MELEQWKVEVAEAEIDESFSSESEATARFEELVAQRHDDEIVKFYQIGSGGAQISHRTERGRQRVSYATHNKPPDDLLDRRAFLTIFIWWATWGLLDSGKNLSGVAWDKLFAPEPQPKGSLPDSERRNLAFELFLSSRAPQTEVIPPSNWIRKPPDIKLARGVATYGHEYAVLRSITDFYSQAPITWDRRSESWLTHANSSQVLLGSGSSNLATADIIGTRDKPQFNVDLGGRHITLPYAVGAGDGKLTRLQYGEVFPFNKNSICRSDGKVLLQAEGESEQTDDYLLVTRIPGRVPNTISTILAGLHGPGTRSAELLFQTIAARELRELADRIGHKSGAVPFFQAVFRASRFIEADRSKVPTELELVTDICPPVRIERLG